MISVNFNQIWRFSTRLLQALSHHSHRKCVSLSRNSGEPHSGGRHWKKRAYSRDENLKFHSRFKKSTAAVTEHDVAVPWVPHIAASARAPQSYPSRTTGKAIALFQWWNRRNIPIVHIADKNYCCPGLQFVWVLVSISGWLSDLYYFGLKEIFKKKAFIYKGRRICYKLWNNRFEKNCWSFRVKALSCKSLALILSLEYFLVKFAQFATVGKYCIDKDIDTITRAFAILYQRCFCILNKQRCNTNKQRYSTNKQWGNNSKLFYPLGHETENLHLALN